MAELSNFWFVVQLLTYFVSCVITLDVKSCAVVLGSLLRLATEKMADDDDYSLDLNLDHVWHMLNGVHVPHNNCYNFFQLLHGVRQG